MNNENFILAQRLLRGSGISIMQAARLILNMLDHRDLRSPLSPLQYCSKLIDCGVRNMRKTEMSIAEGLSAYLKTKSHLRPDSLRDINYLAKRLIIKNKSFASTNFSELSIAECQSAISKEFKTPSQFNKARTMLCGLFEFAVRRQWCERNIVRFVERKKVVEKEIKPLSLSQTLRLLNTAQRPQFRNCAEAVAILALAGVRPREVRRLKWKDIDLSENYITVRSVCSKTGGVRHVEICPSLKRLLGRRIRSAETCVCPPNWVGQWKNIRDNSGFKGVWVQDVLRHTYASFHAKHFKDLPRLQLNMGHADQSILRARYVNMSDISSAQAHRFFLSAGN